MVALWVWQCVVGAVLVCCAPSMTSSAAAAWHAVGWYVFATAPGPVVEAYALGTSGLWTDTTAVALAGAGLWSAAMPAGEVVRARARRRRRRAGLLLRAPALPGEVPGPDSLVVLVSERPDAWWLPGAPPRLVVTTAASRRLKGRQLDGPRPREGGTRGRGTTGRCTARPRWPTGSRRCRCSPRSGTRCTAWSNSPPTTWPPAASAD